MGSLEERLRRLDQKMGFKRPFGAWGADPRRGWAFGAWMSVYNSLLFTGFLLRGVAAGWADTGVVAIMVLAIVAYAFAAGFCFAQLRTLRGSEPPLS